eukprot:365061-Chlamydomonas_euryale.AAC.1
MQATKKKDQPHSTRHRTAAPHERRPPRPAPHLFVAHAPNADSTMTFISSTSASPPSRLASTSAAVHATNTASTPERMQPWKPHRRGAADGQAVRRVACERRVMRAWGGSHACGK